MKRFYILSELVDNEIKDILKRPAIDINNDIKIKVKNYIEDVKIRGDKGIYDFQYKFHKIKNMNFKLSNKQIALALDQVDNNLARSCDAAYKNIYKFHSYQLPKDYSCETSAGIKCSLIYKAFKKVGFYVPGGTGPLISSVLMQGVPAKLANIKNMIICTPPDENGNIDPGIVYAANLCGISDIYKIGGSHAIAAMAYGTETVPKVEKIFGPGNIWVTCAKNLISLNSDTAIDMPAGPSEIMIIADKKANPDFIAADLLSQGEHGPDSHMVLLSFDENIIKETYKSIENNIKFLNNKKNIISSLKNAVFIKIDNKTQGIEIINKYAPEHLILNIENANDWIKDIDNVGSVFIGDLTPESLGDYASGTNHILPTYGFAKFYSGLGVKDFYKSFSVQEASRSGLLNISDTVMTIAEKENLDAHKLAVSVRIK